MGDVGRPSRAYLTQKVPKLGAKAIFSPRSVPFSALPYKMPTLAPASHTMRLARPSSAAEQGEEARLVGLLGLPQRRRAPLRSRVQLASPPAPSTRLCSPNTLPSGSHANT